MERNWGPDSFEIDVHGSEDGGHGNKAEAFGVDVGVRVCGDGAGLAVLRLSVSAAHLR